MKYLTTCFFFLLLAQEKPKTAIKPPLYDCYMFCEGTARQMAINIISDSTLRIRNITRIEIYDFDNLQNYKIINDSILYITDPNNNNTSKHRNKKYYTDLTFKYHLDFSRDTKSEQRHNAKTKNRVRKAIKNKELLFPILHKDTIFIRKNGLQLQYKEFLFNKHPEAELFEN